MRTHTVITIRLDDGCKSDPAGRLCQYDYGQRIQFVGVTLPASYEVHFSNQKQGKSVTVIGDETGVEIPDAVLLTGQDVHVWLYLHQGADDGETVYYARIAVENRAEPTHEEPTPVQQSEIEQAIAALNAAVETTGEAAATATAAAAAAEESQDAAEDAKDLAEAAAETAESAKDAAEASEDAAADSRDRAETAADAAETSAGTAEDAKTLAVAAQAAADGSAGAAAGSATAASGAASTAGTYALKSEGYAIGKQNGEAVDSESPYYHGNAAYYAGEAGISAQTASGSATAAAGSANTASGAAGTATAAASTATAAKTAAESAQTGAVAAQTAAEAAQAAAESARDVLLNMIDDTAGAGDTTKVWSADKSSSVASGLLSAIDSKAPVILRSASGDIVSFADGADNMPLKECVVQINPVQDTSGGDPSPSHVCPITGHTGANVYRTGVNVWDEEWEIGSYNNDGTKNQSSTEIRSKNFISVVPGATYYIKTADNIYLYFYDSAKGNGRYRGSTIGNTTLTIPSDVYFMTIGFRTVYGTTYNHDVSINYPATDTEYHSGTQNATYPISWQTAAGTVYGGNLTVHEDGTGKLAVGSVLEVFNQIGTGYIMSQYNAIDANLSVSVLGDTVRVNGTVRTEVDQSNINRVSSSYQYKMCNLLPHYFAYASDTAHWYRNTVLYMFFPVSLAGETRESVISYLTSIKDTNPLSFWIPLVNPVEYDLTAAEVGQIMTLKGYNAIWADTGAISLTYPADTRTYVDDAISAATDPDGNVIQVSGSTPSITGESGKRYVCGTVDSISITPPSTGIVDVVFTSGTTPAVLTASGVTWPGWFDSTSLSASTVYELNISNGLGVVQAWQT